ncbi:MAG TPA: GTPase ObgE [Candidatus Paceibacterota bacterium]|nr:GTPase ObgE [Candidatus Paceibacterota bacterium]
MAFVDEITINAQAGRGGNGVIRWLHIKGTEKGGPAGGDGGKGGDVILEGVADLAALAPFRFEKKFRAEDGGAGENNNRHGRDGEPVILKVPVGTIARVTATGEEFDITRIGEQITVFVGGAGGKGNARFKGSTNQNPFKQTDGKTGEGGDIQLSLKLIADAGFVGYPNAGKSSLLNALTNAKSKIGAYPFTTLDPHLGSFYGRILADIPGLIEGASGGRGLGSKFLKHIERTKIIVHLVSAEQEDLAAAYRGVRAELESFGHELGGKKELVVLSKADLLGSDELASALAALSAASGKGVIPVSVVDDELLKSFSNTLSKSLAQ